ncbi:hypothetical protein [Nocardioides conyzicola]|uniref:DUF3592 domain-containing protein n=1 Tax=Nocardioides conyzicola TaxID=1651781 RepID=A0ABP8WIL3_9ACTN
MSQPPPSYPVPSGYPPGASPSPPKYRPSGWWFVVGAALVVAAVAAAVGLFVWTLSAFFSTDATVPADGRTHTVTVGTDGDRVLWRDTAVADPECAVVDTTTGDQVDLRVVTSHMTKDLNEDHWTAAYRFDPGSGRLDVTCAAGDEVEIGPAPSIGGFVGGIIATVAVPGLLGLLGLVTLIVTGVLWASRPARPKG